MIFVFNRVPQVLSSLGILKYSSELTNLIKEGEFIYWISNYVGKLILNGSEFEVELRAGTIYAVYVSYV